MAESLKEKTAKGIFWGGLSNGIQQVVSLSFGIILARYLLTPEDYGTAGMLSVFTGMAALLQDSGFTTALINKRNATDKDFNAVFWFSVTVGVSLYIILFFCAPFIADFFHTPELKSVARVLFLWFLIGCTATVHNAILIKKLMIKEKAKAEVSALFISCVVGVTLAWFGYGYWSIIIQTVVHGTVGVLFRWYYSPWRPSFHINFNPLKEMFPFSVKLLLTGIFTTINGNIFSILLGRFYTRPEVGYYNQGYKWVFMGYSVVWNMVNGVSQPVLAEVAFDRERQKHIFRKMLRFISFIAFPAMLGLALVSQEVIVITVTDKWLPSVPIMQMFCIWGAITPICNLYSNVLISHGKSNIYMYSTIGLALMQLIIVCLAMPFGISTMLTAYVSVNLCWFFVWHFFTGKFINISLKEVLFKDIFPYLFITLFALGIAYAASLLTANIYLKLLIKIVIAAMIYIIAMYTTKSVVFRESVEFIFQKFKHGNR